MSREGDRIQARAAPATPRCTSGFGPRRAQSGRGDVFVAIPFKNPAPKAKDG